MPDRGLTVKNHRPFELKIRSGVEPLISLNRLLNPKSRRKKNVDKSLTLCSLPPQPAARCSKPQSLTPTASSFSNPSNTIFSLDSAPPLMEPPPASSEPQPLPTPTSESPLSVEPSSEVPPPSASKPEPPHPAVQSMEQPPLQNPNPNQIPMPRVPNYHQQTQRPQHVMQPPAPFSSAFRSSSTPNNNNFSSSFANSPRPHSIPADPNSPQVRQPVSVQTIGMIGSLSIAPTGNQMRPGGALSQNQQRLGQPSLVRPPASSNQQINTQQRFSGHPAVRGQTISSNSQLPTSHNTHSLQQQYLQSQQKQTNPTLAYRPQMRPPTIQQRPQHQIPLTSQQQKLQQQQLILQHSQPTLLPNQPQEHHPPRNIQSIPQNQRVLTPTTPSVNVPASAPLGSNNDADELSNDIISRKRIREMVMQVDPSETVRPEIEDDLIEIADDFVESIVTAACQLAKHRKSTTLEAKDILLHVERHWGITPPGFSGEEIKCYKKPMTNDIHKERLAMIKKSIADNTKTPTTTAQAAANPKVTSTKTPAAGSPK